MGNVLSATIVVSSPMGSIVGSVEESLRLVVESPVLTSLSTGGIADVAVGPREVVPPPFTGELPVPPTRWLERGAPDDTGGAGAN